MPNWKKIITSGSDAALNSLNISAALTASGNIYPTGSGIDRQVLKTDGLGNIVFGYSEEIVAVVKNVSGGTLAKGTPVHATASGTSGNIVGIIAASASDATTMPATFVLNETLADEAEGEALALGFIQGVNTSTFEAGQIVYVGPNGGYVGAKPTGSSLIQNLGIVTRVHAVNGSGYILGSGRSNDVPNIEEGYLWIGNSSSVATPTATSSIRNVISSSFAQTASLAPNYVLTSVTSSMLAPYVLTSQTSSMSVASASVATSASYALTASFALNAGGGGSSFPYTGSAIISGSLTVTGSTNIQGALGISRALMERAEITVSASGVYTIYSAPTSSCRGIFADYTLISTNPGGNARAGNIMSIVSGSQVRYTETRTSDIGSTAAINVQVDLSGGNLNLELSVGTISTTWNLVSLVRTI